MFEENNINFGTITEGQTVTHDFPYQDNVNFISRIEGCDCADVRNIGTKRVVRMTYTAPQIPIHLKTREFNKKQNYLITAHLNDGTEGSAILSFEVTIIPKK